MVNNLKGFSSAAVLMFIVRHWLFWVPLWADNAVFPSVYKAIQYTPLRCWPLLTWVPSKYKTCSSQLVIPGSLWILWGICLWLKFAVCLMHGACSMPGCWRSGKLLAFCSSQVGTSLGTVARNWYWQGLLRMNHFAFPCAFTVADGCSPIFEQKWTKEWTLLFLCIFWSFIYLFCS